MILDNKRVEILFNEIKTGLRILRIRNFIVYLKYPSPSLISEVAFYEEEIKQKYSGVIPTKNEILAKLKTKDTNKNVLDLDYLTNKEQKLSATIEHFEKMGMSGENQTLKYYLEQKKKIVKDITLAKKQNEKSKSISIVQEKLLSNSLESKINQVIIVFYIQKSLYFRYKNKMLPLFDYMKFKNVNDRMDFINEVFNHFVEFMQGYEESELRALARSSYVTSLYKISNKTSTPLFDGSASDYNQLQINLLSWCDYYHSIFKNLGAPEKHIIEDDVLFDKWVESKIDDMKSSDKKSKNNSNSNKKTNFEQVDRFIFKEPTHAVDSTNYRKT